MSIQFVTGKPGGGKGVVTVKELLIKELVHGQRSIIACFDLKVEPWVRVNTTFGRKTFRPELGLRHYLLREYGKDFNVRKRVRILNHDQASEFFRYRLDEQGEFVDIPVLRDGKGAVISYDPAPALNSGGQVYVIDEAPMHFGARDWATTSKGLLFYARQHRHFGDDVILCAQHTKQVESELQRLAQEFWVCTNRGKLRWFGFKQPAVFVVDIYDKPPLGPTTKPLDRRIFRLDKAGIGSCYDTSGGVGISGSGSADINSKTRGLPWWTIVIGFVLVGALLVWGTNKAGEVMSKAFSSGTKKVSSVVTGQPSVVGSAPVVSAKSDAKLTNSAPATAPVYCLGTVRWSSERTDALLSDGRKVSQPELVEVRPGVGVNVGGVWFAFASPGFLPSAREELRPALGTNSMGQP